MAVTNYQYADISAGLSGFFNTISNATRISFHGYSVLLLRITGTDATLKVGGGGATPFNVSVDGGVETNPTIASGEITLFSGLSDTEHVVAVRGNGSYTPNNCWIVYATANTLVVTGAAPAIKTIPLAMTTWSTFPGSETQFFLAAPGGNITPVQPIVDAVSYGYGMVCFQAQLDTLYIMSGRTSFRYSVDGGTPVLVSLSTLVGPVKTRVLATGLDGTAVHTYTIWDNQGNNAYGKLQGVGGSLNGNSVTLSAPAGTRKSVLQLGDSITEATAPGPGTMDLFQVGINLGLDVASFGVSGYVTTQLTTAIPTCFSKHAVPDYALLTIGRNDPANAAQIEIDYTACINALLTAGCTKIICRGILPEGANLWPTHSTGIQAAVASFSNPDIVFMDVSTWSGIGTSDGVHPTEAGYQTIAAYETPVLLDILFPEITGTVSATGTSATSSASGDVEPPVFYGSIASNATRATSSASGTVTSPGGGGVGWDEVIEDGLTAREMMRIMFAVMSGTTNITNNGDGTATVVFKSQDGLTDRVTATMTGSERTSITVDGA